MAKHPLVDQLLTVGELLPAPLKDQLLTAFPDVTPALLEVLGNHTLTSHPKRHARFAPLHAAAVLGAAKEAKAVGPLLGRLASVDPESPLFDVLIFALSDMGPLVVEPALAALAHEVPSHVHHALLEVLVNSKVKDARILAALVALQEEAPGFSAVMLEQYGDATAVPVLWSAFERHAKLVGIHRDRISVADFLEIHRALIALGATLSPEQEAFAQEVTRSAALEEEQEAMPVTAPVKPGRNEACWCGSGKKYKHCHLEADEKAPRAG